jgi:replicative DNA helicase
MRRIKVSHFPMRSLSVQQLEAHLDKLEAVEGFVPDMLMVDYLGVLKLKGREEMRVELGPAVQELHALGSTRNIAVVAASQVNREGGKARMTTGMHAAEDASMTWTANIVLAISRNDLEKRLGLAKLRVDKNRDGIDGFEVLLTQNLAHGQFRRASTRLPSNYDDLLKNLVEGR